MSAKFCGYCGRSADEDKAGCPHFGDTILCQRDDLRPLLLACKEYVGICASGGVSNTDRQFEAGAQAVLDKIEEALK